MINKRFSKVVAVGLTATTTLWLSGVATLVPFAASAQSSADQIAALLAQIQQLQAQLLTLQASSPAPAGPSGMSFDTNLKFGDKGKAVENLQTSLKSDSSVYPEGLVTGYFGALTRAAVVKFQTKYSISPAVGFVGSLTRAKLNSLFGGAAPAPAPAPGAGPAPAAPAPAPSGEAKVELSSDSPAASGVAGGSVDVLFTKLVFHGGAAGYTVNSLSVTRAGLAADVNLSAVKLFDGDKQVGSSQAINTLTHKAVFTSLSWAVGAGEMKVLTVKGTINTGNNITSGNLVQLGLSAAADVVLADASAIKGVFPIFGNGKTIAGISVGSLDVQQRNNGSTLNYMSGAVEQELGSWTFAASATEAFKVHTIKLQHVGTAVTSAVTNLKLKVGGLQIGATVAGLNAQNYAIFDLSSAPLNLNASESKIVTVYGDLASAIFTAPTVRFTIAQAVDVTAFGGNSGGAVTITVPTNASFTDQRSQINNINQGTLTVNVDSSLNPSAQSYVKGTSDRLFAAYKFSTGSLEGVRITELKLSRAAGNTGTSTDIANITLWDAATSTKIAGPASMVGTVVTFGSNTIGFDSPGLFDVPIAANKTILVKADVPVGAATGATLDLDVAAAADIKYDGLSSKYDISTAITLTSGNANTHTVSATGSLSVAAASGNPAAQTYVKGSVDKEFLKMAFTAGSGEDVSISTVLVTCVMATAMTTACNGGEVTNLRLKKADGTLFGSSVASPTANGTFSGSLTVKAGTTEVLSVVADIPATSDATNDLMKFQIPAAAASSGLTGDIGDAITSAGTSSTAAIGESGSAVGSTITLGQGSLTLSPAATPADQNVIVGESQVTFANLVMNAGAAEAMRATLLKLTMTTSTDSIGGRTGVAATNSDIANIALYDGATRLTSFKNVVSATDLTVTFSGNDFLNGMGIDIAAGQQKLVSVKADVPTTATGQTATTERRIALGVTSTEGDLTVVGLSSGASTDAMDTLSPAAGVNHNIAAAGEFEATVNSVGTLAAQATADNPVLQVVAVGGEGSSVANYTMVKMKFTSTLEKMLVKTIRVHRNGGADGDFGAIKLIDSDGTTVIASGFLSSALINSVSVSGVLTFNLPVASYVQVPKNGEKTVFLKADMNGISSSLGSGTGDAPSLYFGTITAEGDASKATVTTVTLLDSNLNITGNEGAEFTAADTTLTVTAGTVANVSVGQVLDDDDTSPAKTEQLLVTAIATNDLTVVRAINGTTAQTHLQAATWSVFNFAAGNAQVMRKSVPTVAASTLPSTLLSGGTKTLYKWSVAANAKGDVSWNRVVFHISGTLTSGNAALAIGSNDATTEPASATIFLVKGTNAGTRGGTGANDDPAAINTLQVWEAATNTQVPGTAYVRTDTDAAAGSHILFVPTAEAVVSAGGSITYELRGNILISPAAGDAILVRIPDIATATTTAAYSTVAATQDENCFSIGNAVATGCLVAGTINVVPNQSFIWSDRVGTLSTATPHSTATTDWAGDYKVPGVPGSTLSMTK